MHNNGMILCGFVQADEKMKSTTGITRLAEYGLESMPGFPLLSMLSKTSIFSHLYSIPPRRKQFPDSVVVLCR